MKMGKMEKKFVNSRKREERNIQLIEDIFTRSGIDPGNMKRVLDIGCGVGFVARYLNDKYGVEVTGVDVDPEQVECAKEYSKEKEWVDFAVADATQLPLEDNRFDLVVSFMVIHHIGDWQRMLQEVNRVLKRQGTYIIYEITYPVLVVRALRAMTKRYGIFSADDIVGYLEKQGFHILHEERRWHQAFKVLELVTRKG